MKNAPLVHTKLSGGEQVGGAHRKNHSERVRFTEGSDDGESLFINSTTELTVVKSLKTDK